MQLKVGCSNFSPLQMRLGHLRYSDKCYCYFCVSANFSQTISQSILLLISFTLSYLIKNSYHHSLQDP